MEEETMDKVSNPILEYIQHYPEEQQRIMLEIREAIREVLPHATEKLSYAMPTF